MLCVLETKNYLTSAYVLVTLVLEITIDSPEDAYLKSCHANLIEYESVKGTQGDSTLNNVVILL